MRDVDTTRGTPAAPAFTRETPGPAPVAPARRGRTREDWLAMSAHTSGRCFCGDTCRDPNDSTLTRTEPAA